MEKAEGQARTSEAVFPRRTEHQYKKKETQQDRDDEKRRTHCTRREQTFDSISTTEKPPAAVGWDTTTRATKSGLPFQKNLKTNLESSERTQPGI